MLKLFGSNTSAKSLQNLNGAVRLQYLYLDGCPLASNSGKIKVQTEEEEEKEEVFLICVKTHRRMCLIS